jgi:RNA polymerase sigma-70 factor, ECF subfamily
MANLLFATRESDSLRSENPGMSQPSRGLVSDGSFAARLWAPPEQPARCDAQDMLSALARLSPEQREALLLVAAEGLSYEEAAQVCGVAIGTIKSRVNRARERLAQLLAFGRAEDLGPDQVTQAALQSAF